MFLGASYFRLLGKGQRYGASARGLALDTAERGGEEFPRFEQFWIEKPARNATQLVLYALLDSRRVTGAYRFVLKPGEETVAEVQSRLHFREAVGKVGIAPVTSMFMYGENQPGNGDGFRPEVHDSDGLSIASASGEWIFRPLVNPKRLLTTSFTLPGTRGFGLMQRDRAFASYEDLEARYDLRPSMWVEPTSNWGPGRVELVQIPTPDETNDNIVAYWVPADAPKAGASLAYSYRLSALKNTDRRPPTVVGSAVASRARVPGPARRRREVQRRFRRAGPCASASGHRCRSRPGADQRGSPVAGCAPERSSGRMAARRAGEAHRQGQTDGTARASAPRQSGIERDMELHRPYPVSSPPKSQAALPLAPPGVPHSDGGDAVARLVADELAVSPRAGAGRRRRSGARGRPASPPRVAGAFAGTGGLRDLPDERTAAPGGVVDRRRRRCWGCSRSCPAGSRPGSGRR